MKRDPYAILGLRRDADLDAAKAAYRRLAKRLHPDAAPGDADAAARFAAVADAYETILAAHEARARATRGEDRHVYLEITIEDAARGARRKVRLDSGAEVTVQLPAGLEDGARLRLRGQGEPSANGGPNGDAILTIALAPHPVFRLIGPDVHILLPVRPAALDFGGRVGAPTPLGPVTLRVPRGARAGQVIRLKGRGMPARGERPAGHLFATLKAAERTQSLRHAMREFAREWTPRRDPAYG